MKALSFITIACISFTVLHAGETPGTVFPGEHWATASPASMGVDSAGLEQAMALLDSITGEDGNTQAMVIRHGRVIWQGNNTHSIHNVFSCTKSFFSMTAGLLADDGRVSVDTKLADLLPSMKEKYPGITLGHCLSLTSGYMAEQGKYPFVPAGPAYADGAMFRYSGNAFDIASLALSKLHGNRLSELFMKRIGEPIGITKKFFVWGDYGMVDGVQVNCGSGGQFKGVHTTARQMARVGHLLLHNGMWDGKQLLSKEWIAAASKPQSSPDLPLFEEGAWYECIRGAYGYGFWVNGVRPDGSRPWPSAPEGTYALQGNMNNVCFVLPDWGMVLVRLGTDRIVSMDLYDGVLARLGASLED